MIGRRQLLMASAAGGGAVLLSQGVQRLRAQTTHGTPTAHGTPTGSAATPVPQTPPLEKYVDPLPRLPEAIPDPSVYPGADYYEITMRQRPWQFHRDLEPADVWGYWATNPRDADKPIGMGYFGPTIVATVDSPTVVKWRTELPTTHLIQFMIDKLRSGDTELSPPPFHGMSEIPPDLNVWNVVHQHGGFTPPHFDGMPLQWYTSVGVHGPSYATLDPSGVEPNEAIYAYTNHEHSSMMWYHDHGIGITSLNVYAGLAGAYIVRDPADERLGLPEGEFEVPLILADRTFHSDGSLAYTMTEVDGADTPVVNGKAYPFLAVQPRRYRLRILNASNERFWRLQFVAGDAPGDNIVPFWLIGTDGGFRTPLQLESFLISTGERYDVIVDFSQVPSGTNVTLVNFDAPVHFPDGDGPEIPEIMQFQVTERLSGADDTTPPKALALPAVVPIPATPETLRREFVVYQKEMNETITFNALPFMAPNEDFIKVGATEIWEYINPQHEGHPMHVHLINFQVVNRQPFDAAAYMADYETWLAGGREPAEKLVLANYFTNEPSPPDPDEVLSYKDTVKTYPGTVTRIIMTFDVPGEIASIPGSGTELPATYIHHCHILEHEDDDLMRPWTIVRDEAAGVDTTPVATPQEGSS